MNMFSGPKKIGAQNGSEAKPKSKLNLSMFVKDSGSKVETTAENDPDLVISQDDVRRKSKIMDKLSDMQKLTINKEIGDKLTLLFKKKELKRILKS